MTKMMHIELDENQIGMVLSALNSYSAEASRMSEDMYLMKSDREKGARLSKFALATVKALYKQVDVDPALLAIIQS